MLFFIKKEDIYLKKNVIHGIIVFGNVTENVSIKLERNAHNDNQRHCEAVGIRR